MKIEIQSLAAAGSLAILLLFSPCFAASMNKSVSIADGAHAAGTSTLNGNIKVGKGATVTGNLKTINGSINVADNAVLRSATTVNGSLRLGSGVSVDALETVNGTIALGEDAQIKGDISAVNGEISLDHGGRVSGKVENVNGSIELTATDVGGDLSTVNGNVELWDASTVHGDLIVRKNKSMSWDAKSDRLPKIVVGPGSRVLGKITLERKVKLFISDQAEVGGVEGELTMADAVRFSGKRP